VYRLTIIIVPTVKCNFKCAYPCFEPETQRFGEDITFNLDAIKQSLIDVWAGPYGGSDLCLHGGEFTLVDHDILEDLMEFMYGFKGCVDVVTNGSRIDDEIMVLFRKYNVHVGISCDGPKDLNVLRGPDPSNKKATLDYNVQLSNTLQRLRDEGFPVSMLCIIHKKNAGTQAKLDKLKKWMKWLADIGIEGGRFNLMYGNPEHELSARQATTAWLELYNENKRLGLNWNPFGEMRKNLLGEKVSPCQYCGCNIFNTPTLSILPDGTIGNCDRTFSKGIYIRSYGDEKSGRYETLIQTQCRGCKYWNICRGACPMEGMDDDWRNKTRFCDAIYALYTQIERDLRHEGVMDMPVQKTTVGNVAHGDDPHADGGHGDANHGDRPHGDSNHGDGGHGDKVHGDKPHGDSSHNDAPDWKMNKETLEWEK